MTEQRAVGVGPARIDIAYERFGDPAKPPVVLVMGGFAQMLAWPEAFCEALAAAGHHVIRFDNRDAGRSTHLSSSPRGDVPAALRGDLSSAAYTLSDMAADTVGLVDALGLGSAHLVGTSMGGMIAQTAAFEHPERVRSLTSMSSTTGDPTVGQGEPAAMKALFSIPLARTRDEAGDRAVERFRVIGSAFPMDEAGIRDRAVRAFDRDHDSDGLTRQAVAVIASGDRTARLRTLTLPTLVLHGDQDRMCTPSGGRATADAIPGAELVMLEGMGHDLPHQLWPRIVSLVTAVIARGEMRKASPA